MEIKDRGFVPVHHSDSSIWKSKKIEGLGWQSPSNLIGATLGTRGMPKAVVKQSGVRRGQHTVFGVDVDVCVFCFL